MYLYNKNILEYAEIVVTDINSRICDIEAHSNIYSKITSLIYSTSLAVSLPQYKTRSRKMWP